MTPEQMDAAIYFALLRTPSSGKFVSAPDQRRIFVAGMRAAAKIAETSGSQNPPGAQRDRVTGWIVESITKQADELESP